MEFSTMDYEFDQRDIDSLVEELHCTEEMAKISLSQNNHDPVHALMYLTMVMEGDATDSPDSSMDIDGDSFRLSSSDEGLVPLNLEPIFTRALETGAPLPSLTELIGPRPIPQRQSAHPMPPRPDITEEVSVATVVVNQETCCICMDGFDGTRNTTLKCGHMFHTDCVLENVATARTNKNMCPLCRDEMCGEIVCPEVAELQEYASALEIDMEESREERRNYKNAILYFHDKAEQQNFDLMEAKRDFQVNDKEILALRNALRRTQQHLSMEIVRGHTTLIPYKKCSQCRSYGHNRRMCMSIPSTFIKEKQSYYYHYAGELVGENAVMEAIMPEGVLYDTINEHFETSSNPGNAGILIGHVAVSAAAEATRAAVPADSFRVVDYPPFVVPEATRAAVPAADSFLVVGNPPFASV